MKEGRIEEDFKPNVVRPGLFYSARVVPMSWGTYKSVIGAVIFRIQGTNKVFTLAFEDPFKDNVHGGFKGHVEEGDDVDGAISRLKDNGRKDYYWGSYEFSQIDGRAKSVITFEDQKK